MKHSFNLSSISGGIQTHGAICASLSALPLAFGYSCAMKSLLADSIQPAITYMIPALTAGSIVYLSDPMKAGDDKILSSLSNAYDSASSWFKTGPVEEISL